MNKIIAVLQQVLAWIKVAQGTIEMFPIEPKWKVDFMELTGKIVNEITIFLETHPVPTTPKIAKGYTATVAFVNSVLARMDLIVESNAPKVERLLQAGALAASLDDPTQIYQSKKGDDAHALNGGRASAARKIEAIKAQQD